MVLTINKTEGQPYYPSKLILRGGKPFLRENDLWIRKGSHKVLGGREDLEKIYARRYAKNSLEGKIELTFKNGTHTLELNVIRNLKRPSEVNKAEIMQQIAEKEELVRTSSKQYSELYGHYFPGRDVNSYQAMDLNTLRQRLKTVELNFANEDKYYLYENRADKLQLMINNSGTEYLKDVLVELIFPETVGIKIADHIHLNTYHQSVATGIDHQAGYPKVMHQKGMTTVNETLNEVRHRFPAQVFIKPLRIVALEEAAGKEIKVQARVYASNLPNPQPFELSISFK
jgi:hypothetical protein